MNIGTLTSAVCVSAMLISSAGLLADGPPRSRGGDADSKKKDRTSIRGPYNPDDESDGGKGGRPDGGKGGKPDGGKGGKPDGGKGGKGRKPDGGQGGERPNWKELLGLTDEQAKEFQAIMKKFHEELKKIDADKRLSPERKMKARESARKRRNAKLAQILTEEQMKKFREIWRENARPGGGAGPDGEGGDNDVINTVTRQQRAAMTKLMKWFNEKIREILQSNLDQAAKYKAITKLKDQYRNIRASILSAEQARAWVAIDGIGFGRGKGGQTAGGPRGPGSGDDGGRGGKPDGGRDGKPDGGRDGKSDGGPGPSSD